MRTIYKLLALSLNNYSQTQFCSVNLCAHFLSWYNEEDRASKENVTTLRLSFLYKFRHFSKKEKKSEVIYFPFLRFVKARSGFWYHAKCILTVCQLGARPQKLPDSAVPSNNLFTALYAFFHSADLDSLILARFKWLLSYLKSDFLRNIIFDIKTNYAVVFANSV